MGFTYLVACHYCYIYYDFVCFFCILWQINSLSLSLYGRIIIDTLFSCIKEHGEIISNNLRVWNTMAISRKRYLCCPSNGSGVENDLELGWVNFESYFSCWKPFRAGMVLFEGKTVWSMPECFVVYLGAKRRYINTLPFLSFFTVSVSKIAYITREINCSGQKLNRPISTVLFYSSLRPKTTAHV